MSEIKPALTEREWRTLHLGEDRALQGWISHDGAEVVLPADGDATGARTPPDRHALAALVLHDQPFGFTWDDVDAIRAASGNGSWHEVGLASIADRIAALLPPRSTP